MHHIIRVAYFWIGTFLCGLLQLNYIEGSLKTFRGLYERNQNQTLQTSSIGPSSKHFRNITVERCAELCTKETAFHCQSFEIDNSNKPVCLLFEIDRTTPGAALVSSSTLDHYEGNYKQLFDKTPDHSIFTWINSKLEGASVEQCARTCILETKFNCRGFNYFERLRECRLTEATAASSHGVVREPETHYYRRVGGVLSQFINFGQASLQQLHGGSTYQQVIRSIDLEDCANRCLHEENFHCVSFDYVHEGEISQCMLSKYIAANVYGLNENEPRRINHYERIEKYLSYFYSTTYALLPGNNNKTFRFVTANRCARYCVEEKDFICRSFDYQVSEGRCNLSSITGSDVGGLYNMDEEVHHFEMKPVLECGGNLTHVSDNIASPGWPRHYAHHEKCVWNIRVQKNRVIQLNFTHFDLGPPSKDPGGPDEDSLLITEPSLSPATPTYSTVVTEGLRSFTSHGNILSLTFRSNSNRDAPGFRAFYTAEWPCNVHLTESPGEVASPKWPDNYPNHAMCAWRITAPAGCFVRLYFSSFQLETHALNHCTKKMDHVQVFDGSGPDSKSVKLLCGDHEPLSIRSSDRDMFVVFYSDKLLNRPGFHATFMFEAPNNTRIRTDSADTDDRSFSTLVTSAPVESGHENDDENDIDDDGEPFANSGQSMGVSQSKDGIVYEYKTAMWAVVTLLLLLLVAACVGLFLVWRHYSTKVRRLKELLEDDDANASEMKPLNNPIVVFTNKPNNVMLCNGRDQQPSLMHDSHQQPLNSCAPAPSGACGYSGDDCGAVGYQKYNNDNMKNINIDNKWQQDSGYDDKETMKNLKF